MLHNQQLLTNIGVSSLVLFGSITVPSQASAITFVSNLDAPASIIENINFVSYQGSSFTTGNSGYILDSTD